MSPELVQCRSARILCGEFGTSRAAEHGAALLDDAADIACVERSERAGDKAGVAPPYPEHLPTFAQARTNHGPNRRVHPWRIAPARQHCYAHRMYWQSTEYQARSGEGMTVSAGTASATAPNVPGIRAASHVERAHMGKSSL